MIIYFQLSNSKFFLMKISYSKKNPQPQIPFRFSYFAFKFFQIGFKPYGYKLIFESIFTLLLND
jgi:hypothetical protein